MTMNEIDQIFLESKFARDLTINSWDYAFIILITMQQIQIYVAPKWRWLRIVHRLNEFV